MTCSCKKDNGEFIISPYDFCNYCAEKHLSTAFCVFKESNLEFPSRQLVIGELMLFEMHQDLKEKSVSEISQIREDFSNRRIVEPDRFQQAVIQFNKHLEYEISKEKSENGNSTYRRRPPEDSYDYQTPNLTLAELNFCVAWRLADECGYENINRNVIIEKLIVSQLKSYKLEYEIAKAIRDIRHLVQHRKEDEIGNKWITVCGLFDSALNKTE